MTDQPTPAADEWPEPNYAQDTAAPSPYSAPQYSAPQYSAPQYAAPQYEAPQYSAPTGAMPQASGYPPGGWPQQAKPNPHWALSVIALIFSLLLGAVALSYSSRVGTLWTAGDVAGSAKASGRAKTWAIVGIVVGGFFTLLIVINAATGGGTT